MKKRVLLLLLFLLLGSSIVFAERYECPTDKTAMLSYRFSLNIAKCYCGSNEITISDSANCERDEQRCTELNTKNCGNWLLAGDTIVSTRGNYDPYTKNLFDKGIWKTPQYLYPSNYNKVYVNRDLFLSTIDTGSYFLSTWIFIEENKELKIRTQADDRIEIWTYHFNNGQLEELSKVTEGCSGNFPCEELKNDFSHKSDQPIKLLAGWNLLKVKYEDFGGGDAVYAILGYDSSGVFKEFSGTNNFDLFDFVEGINNYGPIPLEGDKSKDYCEHASQLDGYKGTWANSEIENSVPAERKCCGDDKEDIGYSIGKYECEKTSSGGKWKEKTGVVCKTKEELGFSSLTLNAKDGKDGCCGDDDSFYNPATNEGDIGFIAPNGEYMCIKNSNGFKWETSNQGVRVFTVTGERNNKKYSIDVLDTGDNFRECTDETKEGQLPNNNKFSGSYDEYIMCTEIKDDSSYYVTTIHVCNPESGKVYSTITGDNYNYNIKQNVFFKKINIKKVQNMAPPADGIIKPQLAQKWTIEIEPENFKIFKYLAFNFKYDDTKNIIPKISKISLSKGSTELSSIQNVDSYARRGGLQKQPEGEEYGWDYIELPITYFSNQNIDNVNRIVIEFTNNLDGTSIKNLHLKPDKNWICSNEDRTGVKWIDTVNPGNNFVEYYKNQVLNKQAYETKQNLPEIKRLQSACSYMGFAGTGLKCCGAQIKNEFYEGDMHGCYLGYFVNDNSLVFKSTGKDEDKNKLYYHGEFIECVQER